MVPVAYLFGVLFGEWTSANTFDFAAWHRSARSTIEGTARASRYVLLREGGGGTTKFTTNVSSKTSFFRSKTPTESSCRQRKPDRSSSASRGGVHVHVPAYRLVSFGSFAKACDGKSFHSGFLLFLEQQRAHGYYSLTNQEGTTLPSTTSDRQRARVKRKNVRKSKAETRWRELESTYCVMSLSARNTGTWAFFFEHRFQPLSVGGFFSNQRKSSGRCPRAHFRQKLKSTTSPNFSLNNNFNNSYAETPNCQMLMRITFSFGLFVHAQAVFFFFFFFLLFCFLNFLTYLEIMLATK